MWGDRDPHHPNVTNRDEELHIRCGCGDFETSDEDPAEAAGRWHEHKQEAVRANR